VPEPQPRSSTVEPGGKSAEMDIIGHASKYIQSHAWYGYQYLSRVADTLCKLPADGKRMLFLWVFCSRGVRGT
jgi:hypothetical protein